MVCIYPALDSRNTDWHAVPQDVVVQALGYLQPTGIQYASRSLVPTPSQPKYPLFSNASPAPGHPRPSSAGTSPPVFGYTTAHTGYLSAKASAVKGSTNTDQTVSVSAKLVLLGVDKKEVTVIGDPVRQNSIHRIHMLTMLTDDHGDDRRYLGAYWRERTPCNSLGARLARDVGGLVLWISNITGCIRAHFEAKGPSKDQASSVRAR